MEKNGDRSGIKARGIVVVAADTETRRGYTRAISSRVSASLSFSFSPFLSISYDNNNNNNDYDD